MKVRFVDNFVRFRLSREDVEQLVQDGSTSLDIGNGLRFSLMVDPSACSVNHNNGSLSVLFPAEWIKNWDRNETVGFDFELKLNEIQFIRIVIEKDFPCVHDEDGNPIAPRPVKMQLPDTRA